MSLSLSNLLFVSFSIKPGACITRAPNLPSLSIIATIGISFGPPVTFMATASLAILILLALVV